jgi:hypothetical protein
VKLVFPFYFGAPVCPDGYARRSFSHLPCFQTQKFPPFTFYLFLTQANKYNPIKTEISAFFREICKV